MFSLILGICSAGPAPKDNMSTRYLAEIIPPADTAVEAFETVVDEEEEETEVGISKIFKNKQRTFHSPEFGQGHGDGPTCSFRQRSESQLLGEVPKTSFLLLICPLCSQGLKKDQKYTMKVSTVLNGRTISQISQDIEEYHEKLPVDEVAVEMAKKAQGTPSLPRQVPPKVSKAPVSKKKNYEEVMKNVASYENKNCETEMGTG